MHHSSSFTRILTLLPCVFWKCPTRSRKPSYSYLIVAALEGHDFHLSLLSSLRKAQPPGTLFSFGKGSCWAGPSSLEKGAPWGCTQPGVGMLLELRCGLGVRAAGGPGLWPGHRATPRWRCLGLWPCVLSIFASFCSFPTVFLQVIEIAKSQRPRSRAGPGLLQAGTAAPAPELWHMPQPGPSAPQAPRPSQAQLFLGVTSEKTLGSTLARAQRGALPALSGKQPLPSPAESGSSEPGL